MTVEPAAPCEMPSVERSSVFEISAGYVRAASERFPTVHKGALSIFDQGLVSGTTFMTAVIIGRLTSCETLGLFYLLFSIVLITSGVIEQIVSTPYNVYSKRRRGRELAAFAGSMWAHHFVLTFVALGALFAAIVICYVVGKTTILPGLWILLAVGPLLLLRDGIRRFSIANLHLKSAIVLDATVAVVQIGGLALLGASGHMSLTAIYVVMGTACGLASLAWYLSYPPRVLFVRERFISDGRRNWEFGKWALRSFLVGSTNSQFMLWILSAAVGTAATGVFGACSTLIGMVNPVLLGISNVLTPQSAKAFANGGAAELRRLLTRTGIFLVLALSAFCLLTLLTGNWLAVLVYGPDYAGTRWVLFVLALGLLANSLSIVVGNGLWAIDQPRSNFIADICCLIVTLGAATLIIPFGTLGAALAILAGTASGAIVRAFTLARFLGGEHLEMSPAVNPAEYS